MDDDEAALAQQFSATLRKFRRARGWTQEVLAERAELTPHYIALLETARKLPTLKTLAGLARTLLVPTGALLGEYEPVKDGWQAEVQQVAMGIPDDIRPLILGMLRLASRHKSKQGRPRTTASRRARAR